MFGTDPFAGGEGERSPGGFRVRSMCAQDVSFDFLCCGLLVHLNLVHKVKSAAESLLDSNEWAIVRFRKRCSQSGVFGLD